LEIGVRELTKGHGADVVFDTVGGPMFEIALKSLANRDSVLEISSVGERRVSFDLIDFAINLAGFITVRFLKDTGPSGNVAFSNVGVTYRF
jgi:NADPH:quinone reductase